MTIEEIDDHVFWVIEKPGVLTPFRDCIGAWSSLPIYAERFFSLRTGLKKLHSLRGAFSPLKLTGVRVVLRVVSEAWVQTPQNSDLRVFVDEVYWAIRSLEEDSEFWSGSEYTETHAVAEKFTSLKDAERYHSRMEGAVDPGRIVRIQVLVTEARPFKAPSKRSWSFRAWLKKVFLVADAGGFEPPGT